MDLASLRLAFPFLRFSVYGGDCHTVFYNLLSHSCEGLLELGFCLLDLLELGLYLPELGSCFVFKGSELLDDFLVCVPQSGLRVWLHLAVLLCCICRVCEFVLGSLAS